MPLKNFTELIHKVKGNEKKTVALVCADDEHALEAVFDAQDLVDAVLLGDAERIREKIVALGKDPEGFRIRQVPRGIHPSIFAARLIHSGEADFLMKGNIMTGDLLKGVLAPESNLRTGRLMSHLMFIQLPNSSRLIGVTDGGMCPNPDLEDKRQILENAVRFFHRIGYERPNVAAICAVETVNRKMVETIDASELTRMCEEGQLPNCYVQGPISYDLAMCKESCRLKNYECPCSEEFDILLMPQIVVANAVAKCMLYTGGGSCAGLILGSKVPIVLTSRGATAEEKYHSLALGAGVC